MLFWSDSEFPPSLLQVEESSGLIIPSSSHALSSTNHAGLRGGGIGGETNSKLLSLGGAGLETKLQILCSSPALSPAVRLRPLFPPCDPSGMFWHQFISRKPVKLGRDPECFPVPHSYKRQQEKSTALPFGLRGSKVSLRSSPPHSPEFPLNPMEIRIHPFSLQASPASPCPVCCHHWSHPPPRGDNFSLSTTSSATNATCPGGHAGARGGLILTGTQAAAKKSHGEIPFPCDFYAGQHSAFPGSIRSCCLCQEFCSQLR